MMAVLEREPVLPAAAEEPLLRELETMLAVSGDGHTELIAPGRDPVRLPRSVELLLARLVHELARGNAVAIVPAQAELTTQQAADLLNVSRPYLVRLLEAGELPYRRVGTHRRVAAADVLAYRDRRRALRRAALDEIAREAQEMGLDE